MVVKYPKSELRPNLEKPPVLWKKGTLVEVDHRWNPRGFVSKSGSIKNNSRFSLWVPQFNTTPNGGFLKKADRPDCNTLGLAEPEAVSFTQAPLQEQAGNTSVSLSR